MSFLSYRPGTKTVSISIAGFISLLISCASVGASTFPPGTAASDAAATSLAPGPRFALCDDYCALVDSRGSLVSPRVFESIETFDAPAAVYKHQGKSGAVDNMGRTIIKPVHASLNRLDERPFFVSTDAADPDSGTLGTVAIYDLNGRQLIQKRDAESMVGAWWNHPYYTVCATPFTSQSHCSMVFVDGQGRDEIKFTDFLENFPDTLIAASTDGVHFGYVDATLKFVVPPTFSSAQPYSDGYAKFSTDRGTGLLDADGRVVIHAGRYKAIYPDASALFITAYAGDKSRCGDYVRADGSVVALPEGTCPSVLTEGTRQFGYALIDGPQGTGTIDGNGSVLIPPQYPLLKGLDRNYLIYADKPGKDALKGVLDRQGRMILPAQYTAIGIGPNGSFVAGTQAGTGLLGLDGKWRVPPTLGGGKMLSPDIVAFASHGAYGYGEGYVFYTADGASLPYTSLYTPAYLFADHKPAALKIFGAKSAIGVVAFDGHVIAPLQANVRDIVSLGDGLWKVMLRGKNGSEIERVYDSSGRLQTLLQAYSEISGFTEGVATARKNGDAVLINRAGTQLASYAALFPQYAHRDGDSIVERVLDRCYVVDPSAGPDELTAQTHAGQLICADRALTALSRATEKAYFAAQAQSCLPSDYWPLRKPYDLAIARCQDRTCLEQAMQGFQQAIAKTTAQCTAELIPATTPAGPISSALRKNLLKQAKRSGDLDLEWPDGSALNPEAVDYTRQKMGRHDTILLVPPGTGQNGPFWLFSPDKSGRWRVILHDYAGYLRPLESTDKSRHAMPILRTQQHTSCCEHAVNYFAFDGRRYQTLMSCTQLYDQDDPVLFCDDETGVQQ